MKVQTLMNHLRSIIVIIFMLGFTQIFAQGQDSTGHKYYFDYIMGPYLFVDEVGYDAVMMQGARLGFVIGEKTDFAIEYVVGQQDDVQGNAGMTHNVNAKFAYYLKPQSKHFNPYFFAGAGFFEFKDFTTDVYNIVWHVGFGTTMHFSNRIKGIVESRYMNTGLLDLEGQNQTAVLWGVRISF